jgi:hypothetical protein
MVTPFYSIPAAMWWAIVTITTVGYGDAVPSSYAGKVFASLVMLVGLLLMAMPIAIVGNRFTTVVADELRVQSERGKFEQVVLANRANLDPGVSQPVLDFPLLPHDLKEVLTSNVQLLAVLQQPLKASCPALYCHTHVFLAGLVAHHRKRCNNQQHHFVATDVVEDLSGQSSSHVNR